MRDIERFTEAGVRFRGGRVGAFEGVVLATGSGAALVAVLVVDGARAYTGSVNLSYTSLGDNREVGLVVTEAEGLASMSDTFEGDWSAATPF